MVVYTSKLASTRWEAPAVGRCRLAVRESLAWFWQNRGTQSADAKLLDRRLSCAVAGCEEEVMAFRDPEAVPRL